MGEEFTAAADVYRYLVFFSLQCSQPCNVADKSTTPYFFFVLFVSPCSFGISMFEIGSRQLPFLDIPNVSTLKRKVMAGERPNLSYLKLDVTKPYVKLMEDCWAPAHRPSFSVVVSRLFMIDLDNRPDEE